MLQTLRKVIFICSGQLKQFTLALLLFILISLLDVVGVALVYPFMSFVTDSSGKDVRFISNILAYFHIIGRKEAVLFLGVLLITIFVFQFLFYYYAQWRIIYFVQDSRRILINNLMKAYLHAPYQYHLQTNSSIIINKISEETKSFGTFMNSVMRLITSAIVIITMTALLVETSGFMVISIMIALIFPVTLALFLGRVIKRWGRLSVIKSQLLIKLTNHAIGGIKDTKIIGSEQYYINQVSEVSQDLLKYTARLGISFSIPGALVRLSILMMIILGALGSVFFTSLSSNADASSLGVFAIAALKIVPSVNQLLSSFSVMKQLSFTVDLIYQDLLESKKLTTYEKSTDGNNSNVIGEQSTVIFKDSIAVRSLSYSYPGSPSLALRNISLNIKKGSSIAFIGKSGAGKTTLVDVLLGLLVATEGDILVDGCSIYDNIRRWQNSLGYIPQSIFLTDESLKRNIAFGVPEDAIDLQQVERAIELAQLRELVETLPNGLETMVGERGIRLSGGQRQRVGIARTLYHQRDILVLDEATSALDTETEKLISDSIQALSGEKTLIIIAHRLSTVEDCDILYLLDKGEIVASGSFEEVTKQKASLAYSPIED